MGVFSAIEYGKKVGWPKNFKQVAGYTLHGIYALPFLFKAITLPVYVGMGIATKEWNISNHFKNIMENIQQKKENNLEKTVSYYEMPTEKFIN